MVEIRDIKQPIGYLYKKGETGDISLGPITNYAQYLDVRVQIKEAQESGYYVVMHSGETVLLDRNGTEDHFPEGYFGEVEVDALLKLV